MFVHSFSNLEKYFVYIKQVEKPVLWRKKCKNYFYIFECKRFVNEFCLVNNINNAQNGFTFL